MNHGINLFLFSDYKEYLRERIRRDSEEMRGYKSKLSQAMGAPSSFLSQVLHGPVHLSPDHAFALVEFWEMPESEQEYFLILVQIERAGNKSHRAYLVKKLTRMKQRNESLSNRFRDEYIPPSEFQWKYYTTWYYAAVHLLSGVSGFQNPKKIAERLRLPVKVVQEAVLELERHQLLVPINGGYNPSKWKIHLDKASAASPVNHLIWRQRVIESVLAQRHAESLHYTGVHTLSLADYDRIKNLLLDALEKSRSVIHASPEEKLVGLVLDFFEI